MLARRVSEIPTPPLPTDIRDQDSRLAASFVFILPLAAAYTTGLMLTGLEGMNGTDVLSVFLYRRWGLQGILALDLGLLALLLASFAHLRRRGQWDALSFLRVIIESAIYAACLGGLIHAIMGRIPALSLGASGLTVIVVRSLGAGVHEELVFRFVLLSGLALLARRALGLAPAWAFVLGWLMSSLLFSLAHGLNGETLTTYSVVYRALAGALLGLIYRFRSLATAVYTHCFYDLLVYLG